MCKIMAPKLPKRAPEAIVLHNYFWAPGWECHWFLPRGGLVVHLACGGRGDQSGNWQKESKQVHQGPVFDFEREREKFQLSWLLHLVLTEKVELFTTWWLETGGDRHPNVQQLPCTCLLYCHFHSCLKCSANLAEDQVVGVRWVSMLVSERLQKVLT